VSVAGTNATLSAKGDRDGAAVPLLVETTRALGQGRAHRERFTAVTSATAGFNAPTSARSSAETD